MNTAGATSATAAAAVAVAAEQVRHVVTAATRAPSVHNTQPWRFVERAGSLDLYADDSRRLDVLDPLGRQVRISCGAALLHARVEARALGLEGGVRELPDPADPDLLARLDLRPGAPATATELAVAAAMPERHTYRGVFDGGAVPFALVEQLRLAAEAEGVALRPVVSSDDLVQLEVLLAAADIEQQRAEGYRAELNAWVGRGPGALDGIPETALDHPAGARGSSLSLRAFPSSADAPAGSGATAGPAGPAGAAGAAGSAGDPPPAEHPLVVVLTTGSDDVAAWLHAGQALGAVLLAAAASGVLAQPLGQVTDLPGPRARLASALGLVGVPQVVLRLGFAAGSAPTPRRSVDDVLRSD